MGFIRRAQALTPFHFPLQALDGKKCQEQKNNATFSPAELPDGFYWMLGLLIRIHQNPSESIRIRQSNRQLGDNLQDPQQFTRAKPAEQNPGLQISSKAQNSCLGPVG
jgi:hypothetical protein